MFSWKTAMSKYHFWCLFAFCALGNKDHDIKRRKSCLESGAAFQESLWQRVVYWMSIVYGKSGFIGLFLRFLIFCMAVQNICGSFITQESEHREGCSPNILHNQLIQHAFFKYLLYNRYPDRTGKPKKEKGYPHSQGVLRLVGEGEGRCINSTIIL